MQDSVPNLCTQTIHIDAFQQTLQATFLEEEEDERRRRRKRRRRSTEQTRSKLKQMEWFKVFTVAGFTVFSSGIEEQWLPL